MRQATRYDFSGRHAVVTGAASGIGQAIVRRLRASGATVSLWDRDAGALQSMAESDALAMVVDVSDATSVDKAMAASIVVTGKIDVLVNSAGITGPNTAVAAYPVQAWDEVMAVNLRGTFLCCRAAVPHMQAGQLRPHRQHRVRGRQGGQSQCLGL